MQTRNRRISAAVLPATLLLGMFAGPRPGQSQQPNPKISAPQIANSNQSDTDTQQQLLKLLRLSPTLTMVVSRDPSLLSDQEYVARNSPELAQFLQLHPEVARNPSFYLFSNLPHARGERADQALERKIWPDMTSRPEDSYARDRLAEVIGPTLAFAAFLGTLIWLIRILLENRRWGRIFRLQTEVHTKLIDRFGNNQELLTYMGTDAGRRFLEAAPIPVEFDHSRRFPGALGKVLMPLQIGVVLTLLGIGLLMLRHSIFGLNGPLLVFGMIILMPGLGFIISAGITWYLAGRLGLMPQSHQNDSQPGTSERQ
jgi:hypothetical protein